PAPETPGTPTTPEGAPTQPAVAPPPLTPPPGEQPTITYAQAQPPTPPPAPAPQPAQPPAYEPPQPAYGQQAYIPTPAEPWTGQAQAPRKKNRVGCVVGCLVTLVLVLVLASASALLLNRSGGSITLGGATIGGAHTGPAGGSLIYQDALNGSTKGSWTDNNNCFFGSGGYHINAAFICYAPADKVGDAVTTVSATQISGPITYPYGLVIRRVSKGNYYEFSIDANGKWLFDKVVNGTPTDIVKLKPDAAIKNGLNQTNTLSVQANGSHFVFSINGKQVGTADDTTFSAGETGLVGYEGIEVVFSNLAIEHIKS
ncbi:MAG TPA: hypothetical protein VFU63_12050, partial [Ktedonobacterales bacterium]|nr:hypothetical protein [Ktedonobacterales bacterium]